MRYELYYWPTIQGRGEFVRLALEAAGASYVDVARERGRGLGMEAMMALLEDAGLNRPPFAPPRRRIQSRTSPGRRAQPSRRRSPGAAMSACC